MNKVIPHILTDSFGRVHDYLRISLVDTCNLSCTYCAPVLKAVKTNNDKIMTADEIEKLASLFCDFGIKKIRLTGGEPLIRKGFLDIIYRLAKLNITLAITTNGVFIDNYLNDFLACKIRSINVSLDTLQKDKFTQITKRNEFEKVMSNIHLFIQNNFHVKINAVVMKGVNENEVFDLIMLSEYLPVHVRFIEYMPFSGTSWNKEQVYDIKNIVEEMSEKFEIEKLMDDKNDTAKKYKVKNFKGTFSIITTITDPFCETCNRLRLTADGKMKNCLFAEDETDLLTPLRRGENIQALIIKNVMQKHWQQGGQQINEHTRNRNMMTIGG